MNSVVGLSINTNMMAIRAAQNLTRIYSRLEEATESLSTGLRIKHAVDDPTGMAVRESMRSEIAGIDQGLRNATDGMSLIQTADGALAVIDEKLIRMKELAEQAATGSYTTAHRAQINSEYQAMAAEIDRIANATNFNGVRLLNGDLSGLTHKNGLKIHFGTGNSRVEDYYYVRTEDVRATTETGLRVGGDKVADIWAGGGYGSLEIPSLESEIVTTSAEGFAYSYNYQADKSLQASDLEGGSYLAGVYHQESGSSLQDLIQAVNQGTQSRVQVNFGLNGNVEDWHLGSEGRVNVCFGDEVYQFGSGGSIVGDGSGKSVFHYVDISQAANSGDAATVLAAHMAASSVSFWALADSARNTAFIFFEQGGNNDAATACDQVVSESPADYAQGASAAALITWTNVETWTEYENGATFGLGGENWATAEAALTGDGYTMTLTGRDVGDNHDLRILDIEGFTDLETLSYFGSGDFSQIQDAADGTWAGAEVRTQSSAQEALEQLQRAIEKKDRIRTNLGTLQNRLENTITNLTIQLENVQKAEAVISDVDVAETMTQFTKTNIMSQAATSMLAQSHNSAELALSLIL